MLPAGPRFLLTAGIIAGWRSWNLVGFMPRRTPVRVRPLQFHAPLAGTFYVARMEGEVMANGHENLIPINKRTKDEQREITSAGGRASGAARRKKADFRKTLNALLTAKIDHPEWTPFLESLGVDSTLEAAVNAAMIREALNGNVKAYEAIARYSGQTDRTEEDLEEQKARTAAAKAKAGQDEPEEEMDDGFVEALKGTAAEDWENMDRQGGPDNMEEDDDEEEPQADI